MTEYAGLPENIEDAVGGYYRNVMMDGYAIPHDADNETLIEVEQIVAYTLGVSLESVQRDYEGPIRTLMDDLGSYCLELRHTRDRL